jgi:osmotically-inducible protein OsmY
MAQKSGRSPRTEAEPEHGTFGHTGYTGNYGSDFSGNDWFVSDERVKEEVRDCLARGDLDASRIEVVVKDGEVTLTGAVQSPRDKLLAEAEIEHLSGVVAVRNRLQA